MITLIEALNYRCLKYVQRRLNPFHVLVGPNASGKTTFLDVIGFLRDLVSEGLDFALPERTPNPQELLFRRQGDRLELAIVAGIPRSSSLYRQIAEKVSLRRREDESFLRFKDALVSWFPRVSKFDGRGRNVPVARAACRYVGRTPSGIVPENK